MSNQSLTYIPRRSYHEVVGIESWASIARIHCWWISSSASRERLLPSLQQPIDALLIHDSQTLLTLCAYLGMLIAWNGCRVIFVVIVHLTVQWWGTRLLCWIHTDIVGHELKGKCTTTATSEISRAKYSWLQPISLYLFFVLDPTCYCNAMCSFVRGVFSRPRHVAWVPASLLPVRHSTMHDKQWS